MSTLPPSDDDLLVEIIQKAVFHVGPQVEHHSEAIFEEALSLELQGLGCTVQRQVVREITFFPSWDPSVRINCGSVRLDLVVKYRTSVVVIEVKKLNAKKDIDQISKYLETVPPRWGLARATPNNVSWARCPSFC